MQIQIEYQPRLYRPAYFWFRKDTPRFVQTGEWVEACPHPEVRRGDRISNRVNPAKHYCLACGEEVR